MEAPQIPSFRVQISSFSKEDGIVTYNVRVFTVGDNSFQIMDRYRNMRSLWEEIRRDSPDPDRLPEFPPKKWFGSKSREFLDQRRAALEVFFNTLLDNPNKTVFRHIMKYFKKLAKNREAKDAIQNIEEIASGVSQSIIVQEEERPKQISAPRPAQTKEEVKENKSPTKPLPGREQRAGVSTKDYSESCNKIVENFNKRLIDLGYTAGGDALQEIINKGQAYFNNAKESGTIQNLDYNTKLLDIPSGTNDNLRLLDEPDEEIEQQNDEVNDKLQQVLEDLTTKLYGEQYEELVSMNEIIWHKN